MGQSGYARLLQVMGGLTNLPPIRKHYRHREMTLTKFIVKALDPKKKHEEFPNKSWGRVLMRAQKKDGTLFLPEGSLQDPDVPRIQDLSRIVDTVDIDWETRTQLQIMVLETKIFLRSKVAYEATVKKKFTFHLRRSEYFQWAGLLVGEHSTADAQAHSWRKDDEAPHLAVILPRLSTTPPPVEPWEHIPPFLDGWWEEGYVTTVIIDSMGRRTSCEFWQMARHLGDQECHEEHVKVRQWALHAKRLRAELSFKMLEKNATLLRRWMEQWTEKRGYRLSSPGTR